MKSEIRLMKESEISETLALFSDTIDELHLESTDEQKQYYKSNYTEKLMKERFNDEENVFMVAESEGKIVGFLFGRVVWGVGTMHWIGVHKDERGKGYMGLLVEKTVALFESKGCYISDLFAYPRAKRVIQIFEKYGFEKKAFLDKGFLGTSIIYMVKKLKDVDPEFTTRRIVISGRAGQGIKLVATILSKILARLGKEVSFRVEYGPSVRSGKVEAELVYSDYKIEVPIVDKAHILVVLSTPEDKLPFASQVICDDTVTGDDKYLWGSGGYSRKYNEEVVSFAKISLEQFGNYRFTSMIALGHILKHIGITIEKVNFESTLPSRFVEHNIKAIHAGYALRHDH